MAHKYAYLCSAHVSKFPDYQMTKYSKIQVNTYHKLNSLVLTTKLLLGPRLEATFKNRGKNRLIR